MERYGIEHCPCGHPACMRWFLTGIGHFYQGTGFSKVEAEHIAKLLNANPPPEEGEA